MPDWELEQLRQVYELSKDVLDQYYYRKALLDRGYGIKEAGLRLGDIVEVDEKLSGRSKDSYWIREPQPWIGEIFGSIEEPSGSRRQLMVGPQYWQISRGNQVSFLEEVNRGDPGTTRLYDLQQETPVIIPVMQAEPSLFAIDDWGLGAITPRNTSFQIPVPQIKLLDPFNPSAPSQPPIVLRCLDCNLRLLGFLFRHQGRACCPKCLKQIWED